MVLLHHAMYGCICMVNGIMLASMLYASATAPPPLSLLPSPPEGGRHGFNNFFMSSGLRFCVKMVHGPVNFMTTPSPLNKQLLHPPGYINTENQTNN
jgi:hypothetical protein